MTSKAMMEHSRCTTEVRKAQGRLFFGGGGFTFCGRCLGTSEEDMTTWTVTTPMRDQLGFNRGN